MTELKPDHQGESDEGIARPPRAELMLVVLIAITGGAVRFAFPSRMSVEHFDEGVYASNIWFDRESDFRYPARHLYAPPLLPALLESSIILFGPSHLGVMLLGLVAGSATIVLVWWTARRWFGAEAGLAAAALAAFSDFHILYSRTALTDVLLGLWLLLAVCLAAEMLVRAHVGWAIAAGVAAGLAWLTKYNGWLPLGMALAGWLVHLVLDRPDRDQGGRIQNGSRWQRLLTWPVMAVTALIVWSPAWFDLRTRGGYAAVAANHRKYIVGFSGWWDSLLAHVGYHWHMDGWLSCAALGVALLTAAMLFVCARSRFTWNDDRLSPVPRILRVSGALRGSGAQRASANAARTADAPVRSGRTFLMMAAAAALLMTASALWIGSTLTLALLAVAGIAIHFRAARAARGEKRLPRDTTVPACLLAVWFVGLLFATPFYYPYPRLSLPWLVAGWLGAAAFIGRLVGWMAARTASCDDTSTTMNRASRKAALIALAVGLALFVPAVILSAGRLRERGVPGWQSRIGLETIADSVIADAGAQSPRVAPRGFSRAAGVDFVIDVYAEPGLFFHLAAARRRPAAKFVVRPVADVRPEVGESPVPTFLVTGPHAHWDEQAQAEFAAAADQFQLIGRYPYRPSDLVLLNGYRADRLSEAAGLPQEEVRLYLRK